MTMPLREAHRRLPSIPNTHTSGAEGLKDPLPGPPGVERKVRKAI